MEQKVSEQNGCLIWKARDWDRNEEALRRNTKKLVNFLPLNQVCLEGGFAPAGKWMLYSSFETFWKSHAEFSSLYYSFEEHGVQWLISNVLVHGVCDLTHLLTVCPQNVPFLSPKKNQGVLPGEITIIVSAFFIKSSAVQALVSCTFFWPVTGLTFGYFGFESL